MVHLSAVATVTNEHISISCIHKWSSSLSKMTRDGGGANAAPADVPFPGLHTSEGHRHTHVLAFSVNIGKTHF